MALQQLGLLTSALSGTVDGWLGPGIGDPTVLGWVTVGGYLIASVFCWRVVAAEKKSRRRGGDGGTVVLWCAIAVLLLALGINKQLDLQTWLTQVARRIAKAQGWYEYKDQLEGWFVAALALGGVVLLGALIWIGRRAGRSTWLALAGATFLMTFVVLRACSFHHVNRWLSMRLGAANVYVVLELCGILCVALAAWTRHSRRRLSCRRGFQERRTSNDRPPSAG